jgi:hypothetical protein
MTHKIIICILLLVTVSPVSNMASAGQQRMAQTEEMHIQKTASQQTAGQQSHSKMPVSASHPQDVPHGKAARVPHMDEIPHIHRYHKERVRRKVHHSKLWILSKAVVVICQLSLLLIAYMHLTH